MYIYSAWEASKKAAVPQNAPVLKPFAPIVELPADPDVYRMYLAAYGDYGAAPGGGGDPDDTRSDEENETGGGSDEETSGEYVHVPVRQPTRVPLQEHYTDPSHRGERNQSRGGRGRGNGHHRQRNRRPRPPRSRNGRGHGGRGGEEITRLS